MPPEYNAKESIFVKYPLLLGGIVAILVLAIPAIWLYYESKPTRDSGSTNTEQPQEQSEEQIIIQQQITELDRLRQQTQIQDGSPPISTTTIQSQIKSLDMLRSQAIKQTNTTQTGNTPPPKTPAQQVQELDALRAQAQSQ